MDYGNIIKIFVEIPVMEEKIDICLNQIDVKDIENPCNYCHSKEGEYCINPYIKCLHNEEHMECICDNCYTMLMQEI